MPLPLLLLQKLELLLCCKHAEANPQAKKVPSLTVEAVQSIRLILGTVVIGLLTILIVNGHFL